MHNKSQAHIVLTSNLLVYPQRHRLLPTLREEFSSWQQFCTREDQESTIVFENANPFFLKRHPTFHLAHSDWVPTTFVLLQARCSTTVRLGILRANDPTSLAFFMQESLCFYLQCSMSLNIGMNIIVWKFLRLHSTQKFLELPHAVGRDCTLIVFASTQYWIWEYLNSHSYHLFQEAHLSVSIMTIWLS